MFILEQQIAAQEVISEEAKNYSVHQFLYESTELFFDMYKTCVAKDMDMLNRSKTLNESEENLAAIEEANYEEMKTKVKNFVTEIFKNIFKVIGFFKNMLSDAKKLWDEKKPASIQKFADKATGKKVSVNENWDNYNVLDTIEDMIEDVQKMYENAVASIEKGETLDLEAVKVEGISVEKIDALIGKKIDVETTGANILAASKNIENLVSSKVDLTEDVKKLNGSIVASINALDKEEEQWEKKNQFLFKVLTTVNTLTNVIVNGYLRAHKTMLSANKAIVFGGKVSDTVDTAKDLAGKTKDAVVSTSKAVAGGVVSGVKAGLEK